MYIDWTRVWIEFDEWFFDISRQCHGCGKHKDPPEWDEQQRKIEELVEKQLNQMTA